MLNNTLNITKSNDRFSIQLQATYIGNDLLVLLYGGDQSHIGGISYGGIHDICETKSFLNHKDYLLTEMFSNKIKPVFSHHFVICAGIHLDNITSDEISQILLLSNELLNELLDFIQE